jgi:hypothetical protein
MAKSRLSATCAAVLLSLTFVSAQTASLDAQRNKTNQVATLNGCVVRDAANGGKATIKSNGISYKLTAKNDQDFEQYLGKKVEVTGALMTGQAARATSGHAEQLGPPKDQTAVGGQSDIPKAGAVRDNTLPFATDRGTTDDLTGRIDVKSIKTVSGSCL